jgi:hypothetical protein
LDRPRDDPSFGLLPVIPQKSFLTDILTNKIAAERCAAQLQAGTTKRWKNRSKP